MQILLRRAVGLACLVMAAYILVQVGQGLMAGHVNKLSKHHQEVIVRAVQPERFWLAIGFWGLGAGILIVTGVKKMTER